MNNNKFTIDQLTKAESIDPNSINRLYKLNMMLDFMEARFKNPGMTQKQICSQLGTSDSTIKRYRNDIDMDSPYNRNNHKKKNTKRLPNTTENTKSVIDEPTKNKIIEKRIKNRLKNEIKGGNLSDIHTISGKELIDQAFERDKANSILENKQEDNTKLITIARRMVGNS